MYADGLVYIDNSKSCLFVQLEMSFTFNIDSHTQAQVIKLVVLKDHSLFKGPNYIPFTLFQCETPPI